MADEREHAVDPHGDFGVVRGARKSSAAEHKPEVTKVPAAQSAAPKPKPEVQLGEGPVYKP